MKFVTYKNSFDSLIHFGFKHGENIIDIHASSNWIKEEMNDDSYLSIPISLKKALENWDVNLKKLKDLEKIIIKSDLKNIKKNNHSMVIEESKITFLPPIPNPQSFRDFYAFEQHVRAARKLRGLEMHPDWFKIPIFYIPKNN